MVPQKSKNATHKIKENISEKRPIYPENKENIYNTIIKR